MKQEMIDKIKEHYNHAREKHPYFCDGLLPTQVSSDWSKGEVLQKIVLELRLARERIEVGGKIGNRLWNEVLNCEVWEATEAIYHKNIAAAVEECYDAIAVLLRTVDVLEGRQALGDPAKKEGAK
jgi:hypothetical protein